jgi:peptide/nickel transport system substrate-binding protein
VADLQRHAPRRLARAVALVAAGALALTTLGGTAGIAGASKPAAKHQASGGDLKFGLKAETTDYCLARAKLGISGIQVVAAIYDTLTVPNDKGQATPYLAKSVTPNSDFTVWTIGLRPGIKFQDGEPLDAAAVKLNLDTYAGLPGGVAASGGPLFQTYLTFIQSTSVVDRMTVQVNLKRPVADFPEYLYSTGRMGIQAPNQINNVGGNCSTNVIGTGPFKLRLHQQNQSTVVVRNPNYWQAGYPKANSITFIPISDDAARSTQLRDRQIDLECQSSGLEINNLRSIPNVKTMTQAPGFRELAHYFLLTKNAPFNNQLARTAFQYAVNRTEINQIRNKGSFTIANSIMDSKVPGYLPNAGYPNFDLKKAQLLVAQYKAQNGGQFNVILGTTTDPGARAEALQLREQLGRAGINAAIAQFDPAILIKEAQNFSIDVLLSQNLYGEYSEAADAETYVWFQSGSPMNFGGFNDPQIQALLEQGRAATTAAQAAPIYRLFNRLMAQRGYLLPTWFVNWTIGYNSNVKVDLPPLPDGHGKPLFAYGRIPVLGLSKS